MEKDRLMALKFEECLKFNDNKVWGCNQELQRVNS